MDWNKFYEKAYNWMLTVGPRILLGIVLIFVGLWLIRILKKWLNNHLFKKDIVSSVRPFLVNLAVTALQIFLFIGFMQIIGLQLTIFTAVIGAFGVAAGLALSGTLQNFTSGILILLLKPFRVGDNIIAQGNEGTIESIQIFFTVLKAYDNRIVVIPNSKLSNEVIINLSREDKRRIDIEFKVPFAVDMQNVKTVLEKSIAGIESLLKEPEHRIGISSIENDGYKIVVNVWSHAHGFIDTRLQLQKRIVQDLKMAGIKLPGM
jgi:small conductance mechanosensitive channel